MHNDGGHETRQVKHTAVDNCFPDELVSSVFTLPFDLGASPTSLPLTIEACIPQGMRF